MRSFHILWGGQLVSTVGSELTSFALAVYIYQQHGSLSQYALFSIIALLPALFVSPFSGAVVDRINRKWAIVICDIGAALGPVSILALLLAGKLDAWGIYAALLVSAVFSSAQASAYPAAVAQLVPRDKLSQANGLSQLRNSVPEILCPLLGGFLLVHIGLRGVVVMDTFTFVVGILAALAITIPNLPRDEEEGVTPASLLAHIGEAIRHLRQTPGLGSLLVLLVAVSFFVAVGRIIFLPYILSFASESMLGVYLGLGGASMVVASIALSRFERPRCLVKAMAISIMVVGIGIVLLSCRTSQVVFWAGLVALYAGLAVFFTYSTTFWQLKIADAMQGRVMSLRISLGTLASIVAYLLTGPLVDCILTPVLEHSRSVENLPFTRWVIGTAPGIAMGYVMLVAGLLVVACGVAMHLSTNLHKLLAETE